jgi:Fe-S cluster assembly protein SufD
MTTEALAPPKTKSQALRSFHVADFPALTGREEEWRFTPLKRLRGLDKLAAGDVAAEAAHWPAVESGTLPDGVTVTPIARDDARIGSVLTPFDRISALAFEAFDMATLVRIAPEAIPGEPITLKIHGGLSDVATFGHTFVEVGAFAEATLVLEQTGFATLADNVEIAVADGAKLTLVTVADWAADAVQAQHIKVKLGRDAKILHVQVSLGGDLVRQFTSVDYTGRGGEAELYGLYFADGASTSSTACWWTTRCRTAGRTWATAVRCRATARTRSGSATC